MTNHKTTPPSDAFNVLMLKISNTLQLSFDSLEHNEIDKKVTEETAQNAQERLLDKYKHLSKLRDHNIKEGNAELDTETLHSLQEAFLIANHMNWLQSLSENLKNAIERYRISLVDN